MQIFKNLWIECTEAEARNTFAEMKSILQRDTVASWTEDSQIVSYLLQLNPASRDLMLVVRGSKLDSCSIFANSSVLIYLMYRERFAVDDSKGGICVTNIVPNDGRASLSIGEYNLILDKFISEFVKCLSNGLRWRVSPGFKTYSDMFSPECAGLFLAFVSTANKSSAASHPSDEMIWNEFLIGCAKFMPKCRPGADDLCRLLVEDYAWEKDAAYRLSLQYEFGVQLLIQAYGK